MIYNDHLLSHDYPTILIYYLMIPIKPYETMDPYKGCTIQSRGVTAAAFSRAVPRGEI